MKLNYFSKQHFNSFVLNVLPLIIIFCYYLPFFIYKEDSFLRIHDNLDSNIVWLKLLIENTVIFPNPSIIFYDLMGGIPLPSLYPYYNVPVLIFSIFGMFWGIIASKIIMSLFAYYGMYNLLKNYFLKGNEQKKEISFAISILFCLLPFWSFDISVCGLPLLLLSFLNLRANNKKIFRSFFFIFIYAYYSSFVLVGFFVITILLLIELIYFIKNKGVNKTYLFAIFILIISYLLSHYPLFFQFFFDDKFISHRLESNIVPYSLKESLNNSISIFLKGQVHSWSLHKYIIIPICFFPLIFKKYREKLPKNYFYIFIFIMFSSLVYGFWNYIKINDTVNLIYSTIPFDFTRWFFLNPFLWYLLSAISVSVIFNRSNRLFLIALFFVQFGYVVKYHSFNLYSSNPTYKQFYSVNIFDEIKKECNITSEEKAISIGMHPAISQYNGIKTIDGYFPSYSLIHKNNFKEVIEKEISKDPFIQDYFNNWGSRCYAFSSEIKRDYLNNKPNDIQHLDFDFMKLKEIGCTYIFSTALINLENNINLTFVKTFGGNDDYWKINVYKIL